jgi:hypothetical protein
MKLSFQIQTAEFELVIGDSELRGSWAMDKGNDLYV